MLVAVGFACNNACIFCAQGDLRAAPPESDPAARIAGVTPGEHVALMGGEPTVFEELPAWIRAAHDRGATRVVLQTNGRRLAYRGYADALRTASPRLTLDVSLHGSTAPMHDYHTSAPGSFAQTVKGLANARAAGLPFAVTTVVTRSNFRHLTEIVRLAGALGARAIQLSVAAPHGRAARAADRVVPALELAAPHIARALAEAASMGLGWRASERASDASVSAWFAGLGPVEEAPPTVAADRLDQRRSLPMVGRPAPGRAEIRAAARRTGADLQPLFPSLFEPEKGAA